MTLPAQGKIAFANQLRGLAVLMVIVSHYAGTYWSARELVSLFVFAPPVEGPSSLVSRFITPPTVAYGPFGVAIFFLISGFVIPFSLEKLGAARFLAARLLRIYPTYWAASAAVIFIAWLSSKYWGQAFHMDTGRLIANMLLVQIQTGHLSTDLVNWTLAVEVKFYIVAMLLWPWIRCRPVLTITGFSLALLAYMSCIPKGWNIVPMGVMQIGLTSTNTELLFLPFLFIGTLFHLELTKKISPKALIGSALAVLIIFLAMWKKTPWFAQSASAAANYSYALLLFGVCYVLRGRFRANRVLDFFADVSYPLYIVHSLVGYAAIRFLMANGVSFVPAALLAFGAAVALAYLIHRTVELPTAALGKRFGRRPVAPAVPATTEGVKVGA
ncbi:acyltransferase family protein [Variovorax sp. PAMC26660]|uniref:acyltransferase family protein n=1 Tax=Variovorax sp. PAMC26660 TaxID=2762322 RepID=UPI00164D03B8|nr:acyltransferase [Variovorax sp. PAMC26660]QNK69476.1 acyltransferase [Variovorax sp. PAMC26660]